MRIVIRSAIVAALAAIMVQLQGCAGMMIDTHTPPPADWPKLRVVEHYVPSAVMRDRCSRFVSRFALPEACAEWHFRANECHIFFSSDFPPADWIVQHERQHCAGYDHPGSTAARDAWKSFRNYYPVKVTL